MSEPLAFRLRVFDEVSSTNVVVKCALEAGEPEGLAVCARSQARGYGRQGRTWASPEGGLYLSLLLRPLVKPEVLPTLSLVSALAVRRAVIGLLPVDITESVLVKWPNDLVIAGKRSLPVPPASGVERPIFRKLCGISLETYAGGVCVGIGVNVQPPATGHDVIIGGKNIPAYLSELGFKGVVSDVATAVLQEFAGLYSTWLDGGFAPLVDEFVIHSCLIGERIRMVDRSGKAVAEGVAESVDTHGHLILRTPGDTLVSVASGEAHLV